MQPNQQRARNPRYEGIMMKSKVVKIETAKIVKIIGVMKFRGFGVKNAYKVKVEKTTNVTNPAKSTLDGS